MTYSSAIESGTLTNELQLMLALLTIDEGELPAELWVGIDWSQFLQLSWHHRVYPVLYQKLKHRDERIVPRSVIRAFADGYRSNTFHMLHLSGEMETLSSTFSDSGIRALFLKGPVLARDLYGDLSLRTSGDLDLLIPIEELYRAEALLVTLGYMKDDYIHTVLGDWKWRHHHVTYHHPVKRIKVELHWRLNPAPSTEPRFEVLWQRRRRTPIVNCPTYYLGQTDTFMFLVTHGARHGWSRLRWLLDIKQFVKQHPDPGEMLAGLKENRSEHIAGQALQLSSTLLGSKLEPRLQALADQTKARRLADEAMFYIRRVINLHTFPVPEDVERYHKRHLFSLMTFKQKLLFIISFLFPYPEDAETLPLPKALHVLYIPLRPFLWVWRKVRDFTRHKQPDSTRKA